MQMKKQILRKYIITEYKVAAEYDCGYIVTEEYSLEYTIIIEIKNQR